MKLLKIALLLTFFTATSLFAQPQQKFKLVTSLFAPGSFGPFLTALTADVSKDNNIELIAEHAPGGGGAVAYNKFQTSNLSTTLLISTQALWNIAPLMPNNETGMSNEN
jgi:tripartite-type tricarboxylate transporter receptor subunit TctC